MAPATQLGTKRLHTEIYYRHISEQDLTLTVGGKSPIVVKGSTITSSSSGTDLDAQGSGNGVFAKVTFQPFDSGIQYYILGGGSDYTLRLPSGTYSNSYATELPGYSIGGGIKYTLVPYTIVQPAVSLDLSAVHSRYKLTKFASGDGQVVGDTGFDLQTLEIQGALTISKKYMFDLGDNRASVDPYFGVKVQHTQASLDDLTTGDHFSGTRTGVAPFVGLKFKPFPYEGIVVEGSFLNELSASVGLTLGF